MVVSFHLIFWGEFSPHKFLGIFFVSPIWIHQGFLSQLHGSLVSNLQLGGTGNPIPFHMRKDAKNGGFGLETFVCFLSMNIGDTHRHIVWICIWVYMYIMVQLYTWFIFAHHFRWASQLDNDAGHHINAFAVTTTIRSTRRWPYMCTWWEVPCLTSNA